MDRIYMILSASFGILGIIYMILAILTLKGIIKYKMWDYMLNKTDENNAYKKAGKFLGMANLLQGSIYWAIAILFLFKILSANNFVLYSFLILLPSLINIAAKIYLKKSKRFKVN